MDVFSAVRHDDSMDIAQIAAPEVIEAVQMTVPPIFD
jgi:hypothetical protein